MKILHLYHDFMNLYGEWANVRALERLLEKNGISFSTDKLSLGDSFEPEDYDFIYVGSGTERNRNVALEHLRPYKDKFGDYIEKGKVALFTGNSFEMLGKSITTADDTIIEGLGLLDATVKEQNKTRITSDVIYNADFLSKPLVGFINKCGRLEISGDKLFDVEYGLGDSEGAKTEGVRKNNLFGTHLTGPALVKNPHFLVYLAELLIGQAPDDSSLGYEKAGFEVTLKALKERAGAER